ncbi:hypothetical protein [Hyphobacterium sp. CCMP332]|uniref:hypothetical protein n=1 Tax=Hyphobacterium sp. CCMP332 TaxID=2749086 RepID=UPI001F2EFED7|nr:hypothetical protein [Hyphobacterium sp. CCMP332]
MVAVKETIADVKRLEADKYKYGFTTEVEQERAPKGLSEDTIRYIPPRKRAPQWMLDWRLEAYKRWLEMREPDWAKVNYPKIDYQDIYYYAEPSSGAKYESIDDVPPEILADFERLGIPLREQEVLLGVAGAAETAAEAREKPRVAVDAVFDQCFGRDHLQGRAVEGRRDLHVDLRSDA